MCFAKIFSQSIAYRFVFLTMFFKEQVFNLHEVHFIYFFFSSFRPLMFRLRNLCPTQHHKDFILCFFLVLTLVFRFIIHFELIFIYDARSSSRAFPCTVIGSFTIFWKRLSCFYWITCTPFLLKTFLLKIDFCKNQLTI